MRRIELKRAKRYMDTKTGKMFVKGTMYTVGDVLAKRLLDQTDARDDPYFRDHGEISKAQVQKMLKAKEAKAKAEEEARQQAEMEQMGSEILDDVDDSSDDTDDTAGTADSDSEITEV
jgi:uncharacterized protein (DUF433 family)